ncbi:MAG: homocysteine methyltransferase [Candidatus Solibacter usitatus]|nr:homocysteine methyltransferase [Candidatus Solibacter usitatus]
MTDPTIVIDLIDAFRRSKCMFTSASLGVFDKTPLTLEQMAEALAANPDALQRLLDGCVSLGLLRKDGDLYSNTDVADVYLRRSSPQTLSGYVLYSDQVLYHMWGHLDDAVREGTNRWKQTYNLDGPIFNHFFRTPESQFEFLLGMNGFGLIGSPKVVAAFDLSQFRKLVDLGGATGHLAMAAAARYPNLSTAVFDLPAVIETAKRFVNERVELIAGDFFTDELPPADLYAVGRILHDWTEAKIRTLLAKIRRALPPGGALLIVERLLLPDQSGPTSALMQSLNMLICTEGKERTLAQYEALLHEAGFSSVSGARTGAPVDAILARA